MDAVQRIASSVEQFDFFAVMILFLIAMLGFLMWNAHKIGKLDWKDLITSKGSDKVSLTKFLQLCGGITGTWAIIFLTKHGNLTAEILFTYLAYVGAIEGWSKFVAAKWGLPNNGSAPISAPVKDKPKDNFSDDPLPKP